jgi:exopolyphosphatase/guanosine-5'-triphosphate,3'-diphosphate pyrophosphatase
VVQAVEASGSIASLDSPSVPVAIIDVGSNSGRVVVFRRDALGQLEILADGRSPLRLARDLRDGNALSEPTLDHAVATLRDFRAIAESSGATRIVAVATSAVRESTNSSDLVERVRDEAGLDVQVIDAEAEARFAFLGAVRGVEVSEGLLIDLGGGSAEVTRFKDRALVDSWTLPLGALRLSDRFLISDPPTEDEVDELCDHVRDSLGRAAVPELDAREQLIGTGGTIRNLAKMDRFGRGYPIPRLHGYTLASPRLESLCDAIVWRRLARRRRLPGLSSERADSIAGGVLALSTMMSFVEADRVIVSGQGLREGLAYDLLGDRSPSTEQVRRASVAALASRFAAWDPERANRRRAVVRELVSEIDPRTDPPIIELLDEAATLLDVGRNIDYYRRFEHTAEIVVNADLFGFSHRDLALLSAIVRQAGDEQMRIRSFAPLLGASDREPVARAATLLALADQIEHRLSPEDMVRIRCQVSRTGVKLYAPVHDDLRRQALSRRFGRTFGKRLQIEPEGASDV